MSVAETDNVWSCLICRFTVDMAVMRRWQALEFKSGWHVDTVLRRGVTTVLRRGVTPANREVL